jgi:flagellar hook-associated protein 3 FlgL
MRVTFNTNMADLQQSIAVAAADMARHQRELSTGLRVGVASDDPNAAGAAVAERTEMAAADQYQASADSASSRLSVVDSALSALISQATAAQSALLSARSSTTKPAQSEAAATQLESIRDSVVSLMNTKFRGTYLFSGDNPTVAPYTVTGGTISAYQGGSGTVAVDIDRQATVQVGFSSDQILRGTDPRDLIRVLDDLAAAIRADDHAAMQAGVTTLESAFSRLTTAQTKVGNDMAQIDTRKQQLTARHLSSQARLSKLEDADLSKAVTDMNRAEIAYQAALKAAGSASHNTLMDYLK